jgi:RNA polymerase sigma-70 factor, ECF subfamily
VTFSGSAGSSYHGAGSFGDGGAERTLDKNGTRRGLIYRDRKRRSVNVAELYERHGERLYRYLLFKLGSAEDAEDVLQECFCRFARYDLRWRLVRDRQAFVFSAARNEARRFLKRKLGRREGERMMAAASQWAAAFMPPEAPDLTLILGKVEELAGEQKEAVYLKIVEGLTFKEIGSVCGVSANTAASRYRYGIGKLRAALGGKL